MPGQASLLPVAGLRGTGTRKSRERTGNTSPNQSTPRDQPSRPKHRRDRAPQARPPAPCQSAAAGSLDWSDVSSFAPAAASWSFQNEEEPAEALGRSARQQQQASQGAAVLKINVDLGLVSAMPYQMFKSTRALVLIHEHAHLPRRPFPLFAWTHPS